MKKIDECIIKRRDALKKVTSQGPEGSLCLGSDALSLVLQNSFEDGEEISDENLRDLALELLFAGYETTASAACSTVNLMAAHKEVVQRAYTEIVDHGLEGDNQVLTFETLGRLTYINNILKEVLLLLPPIGGGFRKSLKTFELNVSILETVNHPAMRSSQELSCMT